MSKRDLILYKSNQIAKKTIQFDTKDYALASVYLDIDITTLRTLNSKIEPITTRKANELKKLKTFTAFDKQDVYQKFEDNTFLFRTKRIDWVSLMFLYVIDISSEPDIQMLSKFCKGKLDFFREAKILFQTQYREYGELRQKYAGSFPIFKFPKLQKACKKLKIDCQQMANGRTALTWKDVKVGDDKLGYVIYSRIILLIDSSFRVCRYIIGFKEFYYDSEWGILEKSLHPNIDADIFNYGRNHHLEWLDRANYQMMVEGYDEVIRNYHEFSAQTPVQVSYTYRSLREIWKGMNPDLGYKIKAEKLFKDILSTTEVSSQK